MKRMGIVGVVLLLGCQSYVVPMPEGLEPARTLAVAGASGFNQKNMTVGDYAVVIDRGSTHHRQQGEGAVGAESKRQSFSFAARLNGATAFTGGCLLSASETAINAPGGIQINARESAALDCELLPGGRGSVSWRLELAGKPDAPLTGSFRTTSQYQIEGIGTAIGSTKHGPTGGYHITQAGRPVAAVQVTGDRNVWLAADAEEALVGAAIVLLLMDESVRDLE